MSAYQIGSFIGTLFGVLVGAVAFWLLYKYLGKSSAGGSGDKPSRQKNFKGLAIFITLCVILFLTGFVLAIRSHLQQNSSHTYPKDVVNGFMKGCVTNAKANADISVAERVCSCALTNIQNGYTFGEFKTLSEKAGKNGELPAELRDILSSCAQQESINNK